jgi:hypothetical protein
MNKLTLTLAVTLITAGRVLAQAPAASPDFAKDIAPILEESCVKCHNSTKAKGKLNMETKVGAMAGGKEAKGKFIVAGKPDESALIKSILLPEDDEEAMPPKDKAPRPDAAKLELLKKWIAAGATWPDDAKLKVPAAPVK